MEIEDMVLFMRYALPCAGTLVKRGRVTQERVDEMVALVAAGKHPEPGSEKIFKVAVAMCDHFASEMGKSRVDSEVIRRYFLIEHSKVVEDRYELMGDFDPVACNTYSGEVVKLGDGFAVVKTRLGEDKYKTTFANDAKKGDNVIVHWDYIVEKMPEAFSGKVG